MALGESPMRLLLFLLFIVGLAPFCVAASQPSLEELLDTALSKESVRERIDAWRLLTRHRDASAMIQSRKIRIGESGRYLRETPGSSRSP